MSNAARMVKFIMGNPYIKVAFNEIIAGDDIKIIRSVETREVIGIEPTNKKEVGKYPTDFREGLEFYTPIDFRLNSSPKEVIEKDGSEFMKERLDRIKKKLRKK